MKWQMDNKANFRQKLSIHRGVFGTRARAYPIPFCLKHSGYCSLICEISEWCFEERSCFRISIYGGARRPRPCQTSNRSLFAREDEYEKRREDPHWLTTCLSGAELHRTPSLGSLDAFQSPPDGPAPIRKRKPPLRRAMQQRQHECTRGIRKRYLTLREVQPIRNTILLHRLCSERWKWIAHLDCTRRSRLTNWLNCRYRLV